MPVPMSADEGAAQAAVLRWRAECDLALPARKLVLVALITTALRLEANCRARRTAEIASSRER